MGMTMTRLTVLMIPALLLMSRPADARRRGPSIVERLAIADKIYVLPVDDHAYRVVLETRKGSRRNGGETDRIEKTIADPAIFRKYNEDLLARAKSMFGENRVSWVPEKFKKKAQRRGVEYTVFDTIAMDCNFYIEAKLGRPDKPREAVYLLTDYDRDEEFLWVDPFGPYAAISLYEKKKGDKRGKKLFAATGTLVGVRDTKNVGERGLDRAINGQVPGERYPRYEDVFRVIETDSLYWISQRHGVEPGLFQADFEKTARILASKIADRLAATLAKFEVLAKKKMRPRRK